MYMSEIEINATLYTPAFDDMPVSIDTLPPVQMIDRKSTRLNSSH